MARAQSNYKQVRMTVTEESGGRLTARIMVKPPDVDWKMTHVVWHHSWRTDAPTPHWLDLLAHAYRVLGMEDLNRL